MEVQSVKIIQQGVNIEIRIVVNGLVFYSNYGFETVTEAREALNDYGLQETDADALIY